MRLGGWLWRLWFIGWLWRLWFIGWLWRLWFIGWLRWLRFIGWLWWMRFGRWLRRCSRSAGLVSPNLGFEHGDRRGPRDDLSASDH
jgi:hypothetical protein